MLRSPIVDGFLANPQGRLVVGVLDPAVQHWMGVETDLVRLDAGTARKLIRKHGLQKRDLVRASEVLAAPREVIRRMPAQPVSEAEMERRLNLVGEVDGRLFDAVVRRSPDGARLTLKTFYEVSEQYVERLRAEAMTVFRRPE